MWNTRKNNPASLSDAFKIEVFYFFAGPWGLTQKLQAGLDAGVFVETIDTDTIIHFFPSVLCNEMI